MPRSPATNSFCHRRRRIDDQSKPGWARTTFAGLTPATGARTTRFCRTQLPSPNHSAKHVLPAEYLAEAFKRRSSARPVFAHGKPPCDHFSRLMLPRPPQPAPTFVTMANAPLGGTGWLDL